MTALRIALPIAPEEKPLDFGDYCLIEQKRFGVPNEMYRYKIIGRGRANYYRPVPVNPHTRIEHDAMCDVVKVICCGIPEDTVETFRLQDVKRYASTLPAEPWTEQRPTEAGLYWIAIHTDARVNMLSDRFVRKLEVLSDGRSLLIDGYRIELDDPYLVGARYRRREVVPADPFAKEPTP